MHLLRQMRRDPRLAYLIGPGSEAFALLTAEYAIEVGKDVEQVRRDLRDNLTYESWVSQYEIRCRIEEAVAKATGVAA